MIDFLFSIITRIATLTFVAVFSMLAAFAGLIVRGVLSLISSLWRRRQIQSQPVEEADSRSTNGVQTTVILVPVPAQPGPVASDDLEYRSPILRRR